MVAALVGEDGTAVAAQLVVFLLESLAVVPLAAELAQVLGVALVGAAPGLRHLLHRRSGIGVPAKGNPRGDLWAGLAAGRAVLLRARGDRRQLLEAVPGRAAVVIKRHRPFNLYQFWIDLAKIPAMSSSPTGRGQVASRRCCFIVPGTRSPMSASV